MSKKDINTILGEIPPLLLEKLALDELSPNQKADIEANYTPEQIEELKSSVAQKNEAFFEAKPPALFAADIQRRLRVEKEEKRTSKSFFATYQNFLLVPALAALIGLVTWTSLQEPKDEIYLKGLDSHLTLYRATANGSDKLSDGQLAKENDLIQVRYVASGAKFGVIISIDGNGNITHHLPTGSNVSAPLEGKGETSLGDSYELDNAPKYERFFFVTSDKMFKTKRVTDATELLLKSSNPKTAVLKIPGLFTWSFTLEKNQ